MIPKIIHYCWFGNNPLPTLAIKCIASWKKYLPDYEIKEWNEENFDINIIQYVKEAYNAKKYAFVSDYARFWILYNYGGLYFDTDVEIIRPMDEIIIRGSFMGCEYDGKPGRGMPLVAPGLGLGAIKELAFYREILRLYDGMKFINDDGTCNLTTIVKYTTQVLCKYGLKDISGIQEVSSIIIYPQEFFCPLHGSQVKFTKNTYTIHHYMGSWVKQGIRKKIIFIIHNLICQYYKMKIAIFRTFL
ncbi:glycosyl transferase [Parabacteroides faecis]|uniref:Mannosyltransferase OCH1-like enzyme n=1 Tax=Parabacteroides faecis TaxID=1217282 RepID=A0ABR6KT65_9BACT|nr:MULTISPECIES: glycosyltransferase [Parabacteroides]MBB4624029.1 mannosyltransferase OCH1-like enzyme [Parabacteroides faecis]MBC8619272.1 glycosyl transferase [Parabacteroides faecis]RHR91231.1 glycosyl transferase [Parabacteroides sp. AF14-59]GGK07016.1 glycosyl transferase [Parabacteroides faecis]